VIYRQGLTTEQAIKTLETDFADWPEITLLIESLRRADRGIIR
jgi:UDP-N-acetylglucosamine acyltransferase